MTVVIPDDVVDGAQAAQTHWNVPASISIAQWALESGWGAHEPSDSNNPFGVKATGTQPYVLAPTKEYVNGQYVTIMAQFRKYDSLADAFDEHAQFLADNPRYSPCFAAPDALGFATQLQVCGYATDPNYATELHEIINAHDLTAYDS